MLSSVIANKLVTVY